MTHKTEHLRLYPVTLHTVHTEAEWHQLRETITTLDEDGPGGRGATSADLMDDDAGNEQDFHVTVYIDTRYGPTETFRSVVHEAVHAAAFVFEHLGQPADPKREEYAYLVDFIAAWLMDALPATPDNDEAGPVEVTSPLARLISKAVLGAHARASAS